MWLINIIADQDRKIQEMEKEINNLTKHILNEGKNAVLEHLSLSRNNEIIDKIVQLDTSL
jgi:hypothetical protein